MTNTFVMFANKPGLPAPARSDYNMMGPFTDSLIYAMQNSTGEILDVFAVAFRKTAEISPGQEPVLHKSKLIDPVVLKPRGQELQDARAKDLLSIAEAHYHTQAWSPFLANVSRGKVLASSPELQQRLSREVDFATYVMEAESLEKGPGGSNWPDAAAKWQKAAELFPVREWVTMKSAVAWLMADDLPPAAQSLAVLGAQSDSEVAIQGKTDAGRPSQGVPRARGGRPQGGGGSRKGLGRGIRVDQARGVGRCEPAREKRCAGCCSRRRGCFWERPPGRRTR